MGDEQKLGTEMTNSADINEGKGVNVSQGLLGNIPVSISVELGRTKLNRGINGSESRLSSCLGFASRRAS